MVPTSRSAKLPGTSNSPSEGPGRITELLARYPADDPELLDRLFPLLWWELRCIARAQLSRERANHTLQPTALVHELYARLRQASPTAMRHRGDFLGLSARVMRQLLIDHARARRRKKRTPPEGGLPDQAPTVGIDVDVLALEEVLGRLRVLSPRRARIVEYHALAGFSFREIAEELELSTRYVHKEWRVATIWLSKALAERSSSASS